MASDRDLRLQRTTAEDLGVLRALFDDPSFHGWGGQGIRSDAELRAKYLGARSPDVECFLVLHREEPIGIAQLHVADAGPGGGLDLILLPRWRGRGIGRAVVEALIVIARKEFGWRRITVDPDMANESGTRFWHSVGFVSERVVSDDPERGPYHLMVWQGPDRTAPRRNS